MEQEDSGGGGGGGLAEKDGVNRSSSSSSNSGCIPPQSSSSSSSPQLPLQSAAADAAGAATEVVLSAAASAAAATTANKNSKNGSNNDAKSFNFVGTVQCRLCLQHLTHDHYSVPQKRRLQQHGTTRMHERENDGSLVLIPTKLACQECLSSALAKSGGGKKKTKQCEGCLRFRCRAGFSKKNYAKKGGAGNGKTGGKRLCKECCNNSTTTMEQHQQQQQQQQQHVAKGGGDNNSDNNQQDQQRWAASVDGAKNKIASHQVDKRTLLQVPKKTSPTTTSRKAKPTPIPKPHDAVMHKIAAEKQGKQKACDAKKTVSVVAASSSSSTTIKQHPPTTTTNEPSNKNSSSARQESSSTAAKKKIADVVQYQPAPATPTTTISSKSQEQYQRLLAKPDIVELIPKDTTDSAVTAAVSPTALQNVERRQTTIRPESAQRAAAEVEKRTAGQATTTAVVAAAAAATSHKKSNPQEQQKKAPITPSREVDVSGPLSAASNNTSNNPALATANRGITQSVLLPQQKTNLQRQQEVAIQQPGDAVTSRASSSHTISTAAFSATVGAPWPWQYHHLQYPGWAAAAPYSTVMAAASRREAQPTAQEIAWLVAMHTQQDMIRKQQYEMQQRQLQLQLAFQQQKQQEPKQQRLHEKEDASSPSLSSPTVVSIVRHQPQRTVIYSKSSPRSPPQKRQRDSITAQQQQQQQHQQSPPAMSISPLAQQHHLLQLPKMSFSTASGSTDPGNKESPNHQGFSNPRGEQSSTGSAKTLFDPRTSALSSPSSRQPAAGLLVLGRAAATAFETTKTGEKDSSSQSGNSGNGSSVDKFTSPVPQPVADVTAKNGESDSNVRSTSASASDGPVKVCSASLTRALGRIFGNAPRRDGESIPAAHTKEVEEAQGTKTSQSGPSNSKPTKPKPAKMRVVTTKQKFVAALAAAYRAGVAASTQSGAEKANATVALKAAIMEVMRTSPEDIEIPPPSIVIPNDNDPSSSTEDPPLSQTATPSTANRSSSIQTASLEQASLGITLPGVSVEEVLLKAEKKRTASNSSKPDPVVQVHKSSKELPSHGSSCSDSAKTLTLQQRKTSASSTKPDIISIKAPNKKKTSNVESQGDKLSDAVPSASLLDNQVQPVQYLTGLSLTPGQLVPAVSINKKRLCKQKVRFIPRDREHYYNQVVLRCDGKPNRVPCYVLDYSEKLRRLIVVPLQTQTVFGSGKFQGLQRYCCVLKEDTSNWRVESIDDYVVVLSVSVVRTSFLFQEAWMISYDGAAIPPKQTSAPGILDNEGKRMLEGSSSQNLTETKKAKITQVCADVTETRLAAPTDTTTTKPSTTKQQKAAPKSQETTPLLDQSPLVSSESLVSSASRADAATLQKKSGESSPPDQTEKLESTSGNTSKMVSVEFLKKETCLSNSGKESSIVSGALTGQNLDSPHAYGEMKEKITLQSQKQENSLSLTEKTSEKAIDGDDGPTYSSKDARSPSEPTATTQFTPPTKDLGPEAEESSNNKLATPSSVATLHSQVMDFIKPIVSALPMIAGSSPDRTKVAPKMIEHTIPTGEAETALPSSKPVASDKSCSATKSVPPPTLHTASKVKEPVSTTASDKSPPTCSATTKPPRPADTSDAVHTAAAGPAAPDASSGKKRPANADNLSLAVASKKAKSHAKPAETTEVVAAPVQPAAVAKEKESSAAASDALPPPAPTATSSEVEAPVVVHQDGRPTMFHIKDNVWVSLSETQQPHMATVYDVSIDAETGNETYVVIYANSVKDVVTGSQLVRADDFTGRGKRRRASRLTYG